MSREGRAIPSWYRGEEDQPYALIVAEDLRFMRSQARFTQARMAELLGEVLGRSIPASSVAAWETGESRPISDVYRAYMTVTGIPSPQEVETTDLRTLPQIRLDRIEEELRAIRSQVGMRQAEPAPSDLVSTGEAAAEIGRSRQTIHTWVRMGKVRSWPHGAHWRVSLAEIRRKSDEDGNPTPELSPTGG